MTTPQVPQTQSKPAAKRVDHESGTVPVDVHQPLTPTHALSITHTKHGQIIIQDLTPSLPHLFAPTTGIAIEEATKIVDGTPAPPVLYTLKKENFLGTHMTVNDKEGKEIAEWKNPILSLHANKVTIKFLGEQEQKTVDVNPIGHDKVSESFTLNDKTYVWESETAHHHNKHLYEVVSTSTTPAVPEGSTSAPVPAAQKVAREIARYTQKHVHGHGHAGGKEGLLVLDAGKISDLVGVLTLCAMLEQVHKEERFDRVYDNVVGIVA